MTAGRTFVVSSLLLFFVAGAVFADPREQFARETGLDLDLIGVVQVEVGGIELTVTFVFVNERTFSSKISAELRATLLPYVGRNALYVNPSIEQVVEQFAFSPRNVSVRQISGSASTPEEAAWIDITPGFAAGRFEVNPSGPDRGSGSEGIVVLGEAIDSALPFEVSYLGEATRFDIGASVEATSSAPPAPSASASHVPIDVEPLAETETLEGILMQDEFSSEAMAALLGLDPGLVRTLQHAQRSETLRLLFVRLEEAIRESALGPELVSTLEPLIGTGAVMVWAFSIDGAAFSPWNFYIKQGGTNYVFFSSASFVELTERFLRVERVDAGEVAAGVIRLPKSVDNAHPFSVYYGTAGVDFP